MSFMETFNSVGGLVLVSVIWGVTNPFMKRGTEGITRVKSDTYMGQFASELKFLFTNWNYVAPFLINQIGSLLYYITLQSHPLSVAVPLTNSLTAVITAIMGYAIGEEPLTMRNILGMALVLIGITICILSQTE